MLILSRKIFEKVLIGSDIEVTVVRIGSNSVRLGIEAPYVVKIVREESWPIRPIQLGSDDLVEIGKR